MRCIEYVRIPKRSFIAWLRRMRHLCKGRRRYYHPNTVAELINGTMVMTGYDGANIGMAAQNGHKLICVTQMTCGHRANRNGTMMEAHQGMMLRHFPQCIIKLAEFLIGQVPVHFARDMGVEENDLPLPEDGAAFDLNSLPSEIKTHCREYIMVSGDAVGWPAERPE
jgi:hypothetical protein